MKQIFLLLFFIPLLCGAQNAMPGANVILIKGVNFLSVCNALLDSGYVIAQKDNDLMTARTEDRKYPRGWNAVYHIEIRIKDSVAYVSGKFTAPPGGGLFKDEPISNVTNKRGEPKRNSLAGIPFELMNTFAQGLGRSISYAKE